ncbi:hypothetical protein INR49_030554, partial [Caranx melampygus]
MLARHLNHHILGGVQIRCLVLQTMMAESTGFASAVAIFCLGLGSGAAGGLLLGMMAVTVLQSLELLADNRPLMNQLELYIVGNDYYLEQRVKEILQWENYNEVHGIHISMFAELFGLFSSAFSLAAGIFVGSSTYALVVKILGEAEVGKALASAGSVCLTVVTAIGYALGPTLEGFLTSTLNVSISMWFMISVAAVIVFLVICVIIEKWFKFLFDSYKQNVLAWLSFTPSVTLILFLATFFSNTRLILSVILIYTTMMFYLNESHFTKISAPSVPLMLIIADVFNIAGQPIVPSQAPAPTNTSSAASTNTSAVLESIFIGVLTTQMSMAAIGASLFASLHQGESWKICATATAAGSGTTVLGVIKFLLPALGPGPTIGALMGVAWAVGVTLAAAEAATDEYGRVVKTYGVVGK